MPWSLPNILAVAAVLLRPTVLPDKSAIAASSARMSAPSASAPDDTAEALALYQRLKQDAEDTPLGRALKRVLGVCRDALQVEGLVYTRSRCQEAFDRSNETLVLLGLAKQIATFWALKFAPNGRAEMIDNRTRENFNAGACSDGL